MKKSDVIEMMRDMPDEIDIQKLICALYVRRKVEITDSDADAGREISHEEFERLTEEWLKEGGSRPRKRTFCTSTDTLRKTLALLL